MWDTLEECRSYHRSGKLMMFRVPVQISKSAQEFWEHYRKCTQALPSEVIENASLFEFSGNPSSCVPLNLSLNSDWPISTGNSPLSDSQIQATSSDLWCSQFGLTSRAADHKFAAHCSNQIAMPGVRPKSKFSSTMQRMLYIFSICQDLCPSMRNNCANK